MGSCSFDLEWTVTARSVVSGSELFTPTHSAIPLPLTTASADAVH